jgi:hypothetical protein
MYTHPSFLFSQFWLLGFTLFSLSCYRISGIRREMTKGFYDYLPWLSFLRRQESRCFFCLFSLHATRYQAFTGGWFLERIYRAVDVIAAFVDDECPCELILAKVSFTHTWFHIVLSCFNSIFINAFIKINTLKKSTFSSSLSLVHFVLIQNEPKDQGGRKKS